MQLNKTSPSILADVKTRKRILLREPTPHELLLQGLCAGTSTIEELRQSSDEAISSKSAKSRDLHKLLQLKAKLDLPSVSLETKAKAERNARSLEEKLSSIESHRKVLKKMVAEEQELIKRLDSMHTDDGDIDMDNVGVNEYSSNEQSALDFDQVKNEKALKIEALPLELSARRNMIEGRTAEIKEQQEIEQTLSQMILLSTEHHKSFLQEQMSKYRQEWEALVLEQDSPSESTSIIKRAIKPMSKSIIRRATQDSLPLLQKTARLLHSDHQGTASPNLRNVPQLSRSLYEELQPLVSTIESSASRTGVFPHVYYRALNFVQQNGEHQNQSTPHPDQLRALFPKGAPAVPSLFQPNQESKVMASILLELERHNESMALADLTQFVQDLAKERGHSEQEAIQCIYTLVGVGLVIIDRSQNDSIVKIPY
ncbi:Glutamate decarboxylase 2 [Mucor velutinosus]|uniref:Glutamate decarboxylase 2 n=1 Tax=Mucor velutinosus TaxID=708070 RepID=A0AAN7D5T6_9FUNG|nr:Glutamate decarboxylase 2 [Mucor velutinosus]